MTGRLFFDTNVLIYAMDPAEASKKATSVELLKESFLSGKLVVSPQVLNECYRSLVHKRKLVAQQEARDYLRAFIPVCYAPLTAETHEMACAIEDRHRFSWWDCIAVASALQARCRSFVSEDLQDGRDVEGMSIVNPFTSSARARLATL